MEHHAGLGGRLEVVFADFGFASDDLFCLKAYRAFSRCDPRLESGGGSLLYYYLSSLAQLFRNLSPKIFLLRIHRFSVLSVMMTATNVEGPPLRRRGKLVSMFEPATSV